MNQRPLLVRLLVILIICAVIFAAKIFFIKKYIAQQAPAVFQTKNMVKNGTSELLTDSAPTGEEKIAPIAQPTVKIGGATVKIAVADTAEERERGLSGHPGLKADEGLLFIFENSGKFGFWMKDMLFTIDMIWINDSGKIVYIKKDATPASFPEIFTPTADAKYVLEVVAGFADKNNILVGDQVEFFLSHL